MSVRSCHPFAQRDTNSSHSQKQRKASTDTVPVMTNVLERCTCASRPLRPTHCRLRSARQTTACASTGSHRGSSRRSAWPQVRTATATPAAVASAPRTAPEQTHATLHPARAGPGLTSAEPPLLAPPSRRALRSCSCTTEPAGSRRRARAATKRSSRRSALKNKEREMGKERR